MSTREAKFVSRSKHSLAHRGSKTFLLVAASVLAAFAAQGCLERKVRAHPSFSGDARPRMPVQVNLPPDPSEDTPPNLDVEIQTTLPFPIVRAAPPRPRVPVPPSNADEGEETRPPAPQLQPRLSPQEQAA